MFRRTALPALVAALFVPGILAAQDRGVFVSTLGNDTVSVERFERSGNHLTGDLLVRSPITRWYHYSVTLKGDGTASDMQIEQRALGSAKPASGTLTFTADSAVATMTMGDSTRTRRVATKPLALPALNGSYAVLELGSRALARSKGDSLAVDQVFVGAGQSSATVFRRVGKDSMTYSYFGFPVDFKVDREGRAWGFDASRTTVKVHVTRVASAPFEKLASDFAARDAAGHGLGVMSARDTARGSVGGATLWVDYGRPSVRGRVIFGGILPWGAVWRTGANAATQFSTDKDLMIGGAAVPAGKYTLWSIPTQTGATLIINRQTGQWGTEYDSTKDFVRVPLTVSSLSEPVERFTIAIADGAITMDWDRTRFSVPVQVK